MRLPPRSPSGQLILDAEEHPERSPGWLRPLLVLDRWLGRVELGTLLLLTASMMVVGMLQVIMRDFFHTGLDWADVFLRHTVLWAGMLGATLTTQSGRHLCVDALIRVMKGWGQRATCILLDVASCFICLILVAVSIVFLKQEAAAAAEPLFWGLQRWQLQVIFPISFALMSYRFLLASLRGLCGEETRSQGGHAA